MLLASATQYAVFQGYGVAAIIHEKKHVIIYEYSFNISEKKLVNNRLLASYFMTFNCRHFPIANERHSLKIVLEFYFLNLF